jgi:hypothetical protein
VCLSVCGSSPVADEAIAVAKASIQRAEQSGALRRVEIIIGGENGAAIAPRGRS